MSDQKDDTDGGSALNHLYDWMTGKTTPKGGANPRDPNKVPMGAGLADKARQAVKGRASQIDQAVEDAGG